MIMKSRFSLAFALLLLPTASLGADQESLDELVRQEQAQTDNEAVSVYGGKVGRADAIFFIEWPGTGNSIAGRYYLPARGKNMTYVLKGTNPKSGVLELEEFLTDASGKLVLHAFCKFKKRIKGELIVWEGEKTYPNGRSIPVSFSRAK